MRNICQFSANVPQKAIRGNALNEDGLFSKAVGTISEASIEKPRELCAVEAALAASSFSLVDIVL